MSGTGVNYQDLVPIPEKTNAVNDPNEREKAYAMGQEPTASHALAQEGGLQYEKGVAQADHDLEVKNLGWNEPKEVIPAPLVGGMGNEELWLLVRRFNKVCAMYWEMPCSRLSGLLANVSRQRDHFTSTWEPGYERGRRR